MWDEEEEARCFQECVEEVKDCPRDYYQALARSLGLQIPMDASKI